MKQRRVLNFKEFYLKYVKDLDDDIYSIEGLLKSSDNFSKGFDNSINKEENIETPPPSNEIIFKLKKRENDFSKKEKNDKEKENKKQEDIPSDPESEELNESLIFLKQFKSFL